MTYGVTLDGEYAVMYEKCNHCHLFIERNDDEAIADGCAEWVHNHRGDDADEAVENTHEAKSSGEIAAIDTWQKFGPIAMRYRFVDPDEPVPDMIGAMLLAGANWDNIPRELMGVTR